MIMTTTGPHLSWFILLNALISAIASTYHFQWFIDLIFTLVTHQTCCRFSILCINQFCDLWTKLRIKCLLQCTTVSLWCHWLLMSSTTNALPTQNTQSNCTESMRQVFFSTLSQSCCPSIKAVPYDVKHQIFFIPRIQILAFRCMTFRWSN